MKVLHFLTKGVNFKSILKISQEQQQSPPKYYCLCKLFFKLEYLNYLQIRIPFFE